MAISITEDVDSRETTLGENPIVIRHYTLEGTADDVAAKAAILDATPLIYEWLHRGEVRVNPISVDEDADTGIWECEVVYANVTPPFDYTISFDTTGGTQHVTQALLEQSVSAWNAEGRMEEPYVPNHKGAIGVSGSGEEMTVEGTDIVSPVYRWTETHQQPDDVVTQIYRENLFILTGRFNCAVFHEFLPGEVLFLGASGSKVGYSPLYGGDTEWWEITYSFAAQLTVGIFEGRNRPEHIDIGDIRITEKYGWDYLWVQYGRFACTQAFGGMEIRPVAAFIERVYRPGDFSLLEIGI